MAKTPSPSAFQGFEAPKQNWFKMPNEWIVLCAEISSVAEIKVVQYVMRHTWGHQEYGIRKRISLDEFMKGRRRRDGSRMDKGTGLSKPSVIAGLKSAVARGLLIQEEDNSDKARVKRYYSLRMVSDTDAALPDSHDIGIYQAEEKNLNAGVKNLYPAVKSFNSSRKETLHRTEKETKARHSEKENNNNKSHGKSKEESSVVATLTSLGMAARVSKTLVSQFLPEYITEKIDYLRFKQERETDSVKRPAAWLRKAIEDNYAAPDGYISASERQLREEQNSDHQRRKQAELEAQKAHFESIEQQQNKHAEQKAALIDRLRQQYQTSAEQDQLWNLVIGQLSDLGLPEIVLRSIQLLQVEQGSAVLYPPNGYASNVLNQPKTKAKIETVISSLIGHAVRLKILDFENPLSS